MRVIRPIVFRLRALLHRERVEAELNDELRFHVEMETERRMREEGLDPTEARRVAFVAFGGVERHKEETRDVRGLRPLDDLTRDLRYALRTLRNKPLFAAVAVLTMAVGIGATTSMFGIVDALLLRPLPYADPDRLVQLQAVDPDEGRSSKFLSREVAEAWRDEADLAERVLLHVRWTVLYTGGAEAARLAAGWVGPSFEETLGVQPFLGRGFIETDAAPGAALVALLSHGFWRDALGEDPGVLGSQIELDAVRYTVIGVMPEGFKYPTYSHTEVWLPLAAARATDGDPIPVVFALARLRDDDDIARAQARADALAAGLAEARPRDGGWVIRLQPLEEIRASARSLREAVWLLSGAVALILLVAGFNVVNLLLVHGAGRTREIAVRFAVGASRGRVVRQLLVESLVLAVLAGGAALLVSLGTLHVIRGLLPSSLTFRSPHPVDMTGRAVLFTGALMLACGLLAGLFPALRSTLRARIAVQTGLSPYAMRAPARSRLRRALVIAEVAVSVVLLAGAGLFLHSFVRLVRVDPGIRLEQLAVLRLSFSSERHPAGAVRAAVLRGIEQRLEALPGVQGVTVSGGLPPNAGITRSPVALQAEGQPARAAGQPTFVPEATAGADYFDVLEARLIAGRQFTAADRPDDNIAIVDEDLAHYLWGEANPIGRRFRIRPESPWQTVVGVMADLKLEGPDDREVDFEILTPFSYETAWGYLPIAIRTAGDPRPLLPLIREAVHDVDASVVIETLAPAEVVYAESIDMPRFLLVVVGILAALGLGLAAVGLYGVLAYGVAQRAHELGIRAALGAHARDLRRMVLGEGLGLAMVGVVLGLGGTLATSRVIGGLLYGVEPTDPATLGGVVVLLLVVAVVAAYTPARRATAVDPVEVLRAE